MFYVKGSSFESFSGFKAGVGLLNLFDFSFHEVVVSGGGALFFGGTCKGQNKDQVMMMEDGKKYSRSQYSIQ